MLRRDGTGGAAMLAEARCDRPRGSLRNSLVRARLASGSSSPVGLSERGSVALLSAALDVLAMAVAVALSMDGKLSFARRGERSGPRIVPTTVEALLRSRCRRASLFASGLPAKISLAARECVRESVARIERTRAVGAAVCSVGELKGEGVGPVDLSADEGEASSVA